jgi:hypothetical protein
LDGRRRKKVQNVLWGKRDNRTHGKERREILNEDERKIRDKEKEGNDRGGEGWG